MRRAPFGGTELFASEFPHSGASGDGSTGSPPGNFLRITAPYCWTSLFIHPPLSGATDILRFSTPSGTTAASRTNSQLLKTVKDLKKTGKKMIILRETKARKCCSGVSRFQLTNSDISNQSFIIIDGYATCHINRDFDGSLARHAPKPPTDTSPSPSTPTAASPPPADAAAVLTQQTMTSIKAAFVRLIIALVVPSCNGLQLQLGPAPFHRRPRLPTGVHRSSLHPIRSRAKWRQPGEGGIEERCRSAIRSDRSRRGSSSRDCGEFDERVGRRIEDCWRRGWQQ